MFLCFVRIQLFPPKLFRFLLHIQGTWQAMAPLLLIVRNSTAFSMELIQISGIRTLTILSRYQKFSQSASRYIPRPQIVLCLTLCFILLQVPYTCENVVEGKRAAKRALQQKFGLQQTDVPIVGIITRLTAQKGIHLIKHAIHRTLESNGQVHHPLWTDKHLTFSL